MPKKLYNSDHITLDSCDVEKYTFIQSYIALKISLVAQNK